jgi:hypothetical protein
MVRPVMDKVLHGLVIHQIMMRMDGFKVEFLDIFYLISIILEFIL